jgi:hypothetical protein
MGNLDWWSPTEWDTGHWGSEVTDTAVILHNTASGWLPEGIAHYRCENSIGGGNKGNWIVQIVTLERINDVEDDKIFARPIKQGIPCRDPAPAPIKGSILYSIKRSKNITKRAPRGRQPIIRRSVRQTERQNRLDTRGNSFPIGCHADSIMVIQVNELDPEIVVITRTPLSCDYFPDIVNEHIVRKTQCQMNGRLRVKRALTHERIRLRAKNAEHMSTGRIHGVLKEELATITLRFAREEGD